jgi:hypothetical protein
VIAGLMRALAAVLATLLLAALAAPTADARRSQFTIFEAPRELHSHDAAVRAQALDEIEALGVRWIRMVLYWNRVAPSPNRGSRPDVRLTNPASYDWTSYERVVAEARARGIRVLLTPSGPVPRWATLTRQNHVDYPSPTYFYRFMKAAGRQFGARIRYWSIWNEPNHPEFLGPQYRRGKAYSPRLYRRLVQRARKALDRTGNGRDRVLMGETAPRGNSNVVHPLRFLRGALCLNRRYHKRRRCGRLDVDGYAHHPYTTRTGPFFVSRRRDDVTIGSLSRLTRALDRAARAGAVRRRLGIYLTEFGIQSKPDPHYGVGELRQAEYRSIGERIAWRNGRVRAFSQYLMRDDDPRTGRDRFGGFESGLRYHDGDRKKAYNGFRLPMVARRAGRRVRLWGLVRPAAGRTRVEIRYRDRRGGWKRLKRDRTDRRGYWRTTTRYKRRRSYAVRWNAPGDRRYHGPRTRVIRWR